MKKYKWQTKYFITSMLSTLLVLTLFSGFVIAEKNIRYIAFGDTSPFLVYEQKNMIPVYIKIHFMGKDFIINF